jgi:hypothetical protein
MYAEWPAAVATLGAMAQAEASTVADGKPTFSVGLPEHPGSTPHLTAGRPSPDC